jgi:hypothetical protein
MESKLLSAVGKVAGLGGLALGIFLLIFQGVLQKQFLPQAGLGSAQAFAIILSLMILTFGIAGIGIVAWLFSRTIGPKASVSAAMMATLAGLILVVIGAAVYVGAQAKSDAPHSSNVEAGPSGVAIGGSANNSTITIGITLDRVEELISQRTTQFAELSSVQRAYIVQLRRDLDLNEDQLRAALEIMDERDVPREKSLGKLTEIARRFRKLNEEVAARDGDSDEVADLRKAARAAIDVGDIDKADELLSKIELKRVRRAEYQGNVEPPKVEASDCKIGQLLLEEQKEKEKEEEEEKERPCLNANFWLKNQYGNWLNVKYDDSRIKVVTVGAIKSPCAGRSEELSSIKDILARYILYKCILSTPIQMI